MMRRPNKIAAANSHRAFSFDLNMKFAHHHSRLSPQPVAVAEKLGHLPCATSF